MSGETKDPVSEQEEVEELDDKTHEKQEAHNFDDVPLQDSSEEPCTIPELHRLSSKSSHRYRYMSRQIKDPVSGPKKVKDTNEKNHEKQKAHDREDVPTQDSSEELCKICTFPEIHRLFKLKVWPNIPMSESLELLRSGKIRDKKRLPGVKKPGLSSRMEYLARPKKDFLDRVGFERLDGVLPEKSLPSWPILPLPTKLPAGRYPYRITMTKLAENLFLPPPGKKMNLRDENNLCPPKKVYQSLHDPYLKAHFNKDPIRKHLKKNGFVSKSGKVFCSLEAINDYREYTRRILAENIQQMYRDEEEERKKQNERRIKIKNEEEDDKERERTSRVQTSLRSYIKNTVSSIQEGSMDTQREKDRKTLIKQIKLRSKFKQRALDKQERCEQVLNRHMIEKHEREEKRKSIELELAKLDIEQIEKLCRLKEREKLNRRHQLEDFWLRKAEEQIKWVDKGLELEREWFEDREAKVASRKEQAIAPDLDWRTPKTKDSKSQEAVDRTKDDLTLEDILRDEICEVSSTEWLQVEDSDDETVMANVDIFDEEMFDQLGAEVISKIVMAVPGILDEKDTKSKSFSS